MKRYHVTTFGCQMNEHDSERMKGMLESLGYAEAAEREDADLILFNTCSIREAADERFVAHLGDAQARSSASGPDVIVGVGGCWAQSVKDEVFERFPFVDVAFGPGQVHKLAEFLTSRLAHRAGLLRVRGLHRPPADASRAREFQALGADLRRLQLRAARTASCPRTRGREVSAAARRARRRGRAAGRRRRARGDAARAERQLLRPRPARRESAPRSFAELLRALDAIDGIDRIRYTSPHPQGHARGRDPRARRARRASASTSTCRCSRARRRILKAMRRTYDARALPRPRRADPRARARLRDHDRHHRRLPGRDRGRTSRRRSRSSRRSASTAPSRSSTRRAAAPRRRRCTDGLVPHEVKVERMERLVEVVQRRARERAQRFVGRTLDVLVEGPSRTDPTRLRGRTRHNKAVELRRPRATPGEIVQVEITGATSQTLAGEDVAARPRRCALTTRLSPCAERGRRSALAAVARREAVGDPRAAQPLGSCAPRAPARAPRTSAPARRPSGATSTSAAVALDRVARRPLGDVLRAARADVRAAARPPASGTCPRRG